MRERVEELVGRRARIMWVSTFHSACVRILRKEIERFGYKSSFSIYDATDSKRLMTLVCRELDLDAKRYQPRAILNWVSNQKNELIDHEEAKANAKNHLEETYAEAFAVYQRKLREANALDFDDIIMITVHIFQSFPEVRETYRRRFRHVLVDEYQDTNHAQYALIRELCGTSVGRPASGGDDPDVPDGDGGVGPSELMVVGDADQSIYAFRGANIRNILQFEEDFPDARTVLLEQNYRSTQTILNAANAVIEQQLRAQGEEPLVRPGTGRARSSATSVTTSTTRRGSSPTRSTSSPTQASPRPATSRSSTAPTLSPVCSRRCSSASGCPTRWSAGCASTSARRSATRSPTCGSWPTRPTRSACAASSTCPSAASATVPRPWSTRSRSVSGSPSSRRCGGPRRRPAWPAARSTASGPSSRWRRS